MNSKVNLRVAVLSIISALLLGAFAPATVVNAASGDTVVYITKTGECYHSSGCSSLRRSKIETTLKSAVERGYRPCSAARRRHPYPQAVRHRESPSPTGP